jgi:sugar phosphate isomerase/epimerase
MKLGVLTVPLSGLSAEEAFKYLSGLGVQAVEIGAGGFPGNAHLKPLDLAGDPAKAAEYKALTARYGLEISALSVHGNPVHPDKAIAQKAHEEFIAACRAAQSLGVDTVVTFSGCPGDCPTSQYPNWVTCAWPNDFPAILRYQWDEVLIPYWKAAVKEAAGFGIRKIALEMHPGFCVYNPGTLLRLRSAVGEAIGANFDPSHLYWQGIDPVQAIKALRGAIYHFHAKDTLIDSANTAVNGVLDQTNYGDIINRAWVFRTVGYGHDLAHWKGIISALRLAGYEGSVSIEHEDGLMSQREGLEKAIAFLKDVLIFQNPTEMWWA